MKQRVRGGGTPRSVGATVCRLLVGTGLALVALAALASAAGAAGCPNEALRVGAGALLPPCRAYEMVTPVEKAGGNATPVIGMRAREDGDAVLFHSSASFAGSPGSLLANPYVARRGANWTSEPITPPSYNRRDLLTGAAPASSPELGKSLQISKIALTPGAIEEGSNVYVRDNLSGARELVVAKPGDELFHAAAGLGGGFFLEGSSGWTHLLLHTSVPMLAGAHEGFQSLYDWSGGRLRLVSRLPNGTVPEEDVETQVPPYAHLLSTDGSRLYYNFYESPLYLRENGAPARPVSVSRRNGSVGEAEPGRFGIASADGSVVYFISRADLLNGSTTGGSEALYRYEVGTDSLTDLTPVSLAGPGGADVRSVLGASQDGSYVYFTAGAGLGKGIPDAPSEGVDVYAAHAGEVELVGALENGQQEFNGPDNWSTSPDGRFFAFSSYSALSAADLPSPACPTSPVANNKAESCLDAYLFEFEGGQTICVTCNGPGQGNSEVGGQSFHETGFGKEFPHSVLDDGTVFVETPNRLLAADVNGTGDVYAYRAGALRLVSTGTSSQESQFGDATPDGSDVYFFTGQALVPQDIDQSVDIYDERELGGLASQFLAGEPAPCNDERCRGASPAPPPASSLGSAANSPCRSLDVATAKARHQAKTLSRRAKRARSAGQAANRVKHLRRAAAHGSHRAKALGRRADRCKGGAR